jgi:Domain of unknown function (DUF1772)
MTSPRLLTAIRAVSLGSTTLILGMLFAHVLELSPKRELPYASYVVVQQNLYRDWGPVGSVLEPLALLSTGLLAVLLWRARRPGTVAAVVAALGQLIALVVFFTVVNPVNGKQAGWTAAAPPANWQHVRDMWEYGHAVRGLLYAVAFALLLATVLRDARHRAGARVPVEDTRGPVRSTS